MTNIVDAAWHKVLTTYGEPFPPEASPLLEPSAKLVRVAHAEPLLRRLSPWTGMRELHFSRCTEMDYTWDIPYIGTLRDSRYFVEGPHRSGPRIAETDSAQATVAMVIDRLPPRCGPAFIHTARELPAYEAQAESRPDARTG
ncbi:DUF6193 family natural product biosynthesis protein [Streptomyces bacillaris]|uniref:DUF6193 family natural product biosynthesis protein n=1 Tax=Streptomyces bacillaris TaxID=68179 RepID=UPI0038189C3E